MKLYSFEDVPPLDYYSFVILLLSVIDDRNYEYKFLNIKTNEIANFEGLYWKDLGLNQKLLDSVVEQFNSMFGFKITGITLDNKIEDFIVMLLDMWGKCQGILRFDIVGSNGEIQSHFHHIDILRQEVASIAYLFKDAKSMINTVPLMRLYGFLYGLLMPLVLKIPVRLAHPISEVIIEEMKPHDVIVGIPFLWINMAEKYKKGEIQARGDDISIITATSAVPSKLLHELRNNGFKTLELFGSTELGGCGFRSDPDYAYSLYPYLSRSDNSLEELERELPNGSIAVITLLDTVYWVDQRSLRPIARKDCAVQVTGHSVFPNYIARVIEEYPDVKACLVRLMTPDEGYKLKAFVVPCDGADIEKLSISLGLFLSERLDAHQFPGRFTFGTVIPADTFGKLFNW